MLSHMKLCVEIILNRLKLCFCQIRNIGNSWKDQMLSASSETYSGALGNISRVFIPNVFLWRPQFVIDQNKETVTDIKINFNWYYRHHRSVISSEHGWEQVRKNIPTDWSKNDKPASGAWWVSKNLSHPHSDGWFIQHLMVGIPNLMVSIPNLIVGIPNLMVGILNLMVDIPNLMVGIPNLMVGIPNLMVGLSQTTNIKPSLTIFISTTKYLIQ